MRYDEKPYWDIERARIGDTRTVPVELVVNGRVKAAEPMLADGNVRELEFTTRLHRSAWVALRIPMSSHTNPIFVTVDGQPIRASRRSAEWCQAAVLQCWSQKGPRIRESDRKDAWEAYQHAYDTYTRRIAESPIP